MVPALFFACMTESAAMPKLSWHGIRPACRNVQPFALLVQIAQRRGFLRLISGVVPDARARGADLRRPPPGRGDRAAKKAAFWRGKGGASAERCRCSARRKSGRPGKHPSGSRPGGRTRKRGCRRAGAEEERGKRRRRRLLCHERQARSMHARVSERRRLSGKGMRKACRLLTCGHKRIFWNWPVGMRPAFLLVYWNLLRRMRRIVHS